MPTPSRHRHPKYIFVIGGVISGVGKGVTVSSISKILQDRGLTVTAIKIDPYVNVDAGTMNPTEHGEVFVLNNGLETDQDMGNYERFLGKDIPDANYMTTGMVYQSVINKERSMKYGGRCVQVVPHIPLEVVERIERAQALAKADVTVIEIGGTVGEYENILFLEAARMLHIKNPHDVFFIMVSYLPMPSKIGEMKTKPTQHAVRTVNASGIQPDVIIARSEIPLDQKRKEKLSFFCNLSPERIISAPDVDTIYDIPINFEKEGLSTLLCTLLDIKAKRSNTTLIKEWKRLVAHAHQAKREVKIAVVGKYFETGDFVLSDSYLSVIEAIKFSCFAQGLVPKLTWLNSFDFEKNTKKLSELKKYDGILVPGGFGSRGIEGKIKVIEYARTHKIPYFGLCYGMQLAVIEYARHVAHMADANSREVNPKSNHLVIDIMEDQKDKMKENHYGGSMRLGLYPCVLKEGTIAKEAYGKKIIQERHRHRYEVNPLFIKDLEQAGLVFSGTSPDKTLMEIVELPHTIHPFFVGTQFHPEFLARPLTPHPLFSEFIHAAAHIRTQKNK